MSDFPGRSGERSARPSFTRLRTIVGEHGVARAGEAADAGADEVGDARRKAGEVTEAPDRSAAIADEHGLAAVLDDAEPVATGDREDRLHVAGEPEEVDRHDGASARTDRGREESGIEAVRAGIDVDEPGDEPAREHDVGARDEAHRRDDHLVAVLPPVDLAERGERALERARTAVAEGREADRVRLRHHGFETLAERAVREPSAFEDLRDVCFGTRGDARGADRYGAEGGGHGVSSSQA